MIGFLIGTIHSKQPPLLQLTVNGVGYDIQSPMSTFYALPEVGEQATVLTHLHVREDAMLLFGFATELEKKLFRELIKVNGIGAKMGIAILSSMSVAEFVGYVNEADSMAITKIPGVGKKTAERLVIEMQDKLKSWQQDPNLSLLESSLVKLNVLAKPTNDVSAVQALLALGYKLAQAEKMVKSVDKGLSLEETIKKALQQA